MIWNLWVYLLIYWSVLPNIANKCLLSLTFKARWAVTLRSQSAHLSAKTGMHTSYTKHTVHECFSVCHCVVTIQHFTNWTRSLINTICSLCFSHNCALETWRGHQIWCEYANTKEDYKYVMSKTHCLVKQFEKMPMLSVLSNCFMSLSII